MIQSRRPAPQDIAKKSVPSSLIVFESFVRGRHWNNLHFILQQNGLAGFGPNETGSIQTQMCDVLLYTARQDEVGRRLILGDRFQRWYVQVVSVNVGAEHVIQLRQLVSRNRRRFHSFLGKPIVAIFYFQGVREIGVNDPGQVRRTEEKTGLA